MILACVSLEPKAGAENPASNNDLGLSGAYKVIEKSSQPNTKQLVLYCGQATLRDQGRRIISIREFFC